MSLLVTGINNGGIKFDTQAAVQNLALRTIIIWMTGFINPSNADYNLVALDGAAATDEQWQVLSSWDNAGHHRLRFISHWATTDGQWTSGNLPLGGPMMLALTYDKSAAGNNPAMYYAFGNNPLTTLTVTRNTLPVGGYRSGTNNNLYILKDVVNGQSLAGQYQECRIYNRALGTGELNALGIGTRRIEMNDNGLVFHAPLIYALNRYPTIPFAGALGASDFMYDRINGTKGTPTPVSQLFGSNDFVYSSGF